MKSIYSVILVMVIMWSCYDPQFRKITVDECNLEPDAGPCMALFTKYYFDKAEGKCKSFVWGGCQGTVPFETMEECRQCECERTPIAE